MEKLLTFSQLDARRPATQREDLADLFGEDYVDELSDDDIRDLHYRTFDSDVLNRD